MSKGFASNRLTLLAVGVIACFVTVGVRLVFLHVLDRDDLLRFVDKARRQIVVEHARRGTILDTHGNLLATSRSEITVAVDPWALDEYLASDTNEPRRARRRAEELAKRTELATLLGLPAAEVEKAFQPARRAIKPENDTRDGKVDGQTKDRWVKLREEVDEPTFDKIEALGVRGLTFERAYRRVYPSGSLAAQVIGYVNKEGQPVTGAEHHFDLYLKGQDGWIESEKDGARRELAQFRSREVPVQDGNDVVLSIDSVVQHIIEDELKTIAAKYTPHFATIIASDPMTGAILGMASYPSYDLNNYSKAPPDSQRNYAVTDIIEPGSTFKIVAAGAALNEGLVTPFTSFDCGSPTIDYKGRTIKLPKEDEQFGRLSVAQIVSFSSNRGAAQLGMLLGEQRFYDYARKFGFGETTAFALGGEVRGQMASPDKWDGLTISRMPMGQSIAATPLQIHMAMSAVANGGVLLRPQIIREIRDSDGKVIRTFPPEKRATVLRPATAALLAQLLTGVVREGTGKAADIPGFELAGKTGTAQKVINGKYSSDHHVASFVGFFPASRPEIVLSVIVDDAHVPGSIAYGRIVAVPAFHHIAEQLIQYLDIKPVLPATPNILAMQGGVR
jgi:cell division protein FtsI (penicillin-binding protein 3)